jgi:hypothetical protein
MVKTHRRPGVGLVAALALSFACPLAGAAEKRAEKPATRPATRPAGKVFRAMFAPGKRATGKTSWSGLARLAGSRDGELTAFVTTYLGDKFPVTIAGAKEPLFWGEMIGGDDDKLELRMTRPDGTKQVLELPRDRAVEFEVGEKAFKLAYASTSVEAERQPVWDHATIIVTHRPKQQ